MQIYVSSYSIKDTSRQKGLSIFDLPEFARKNGFDGLEISDWEIRCFDNNLLQRLYRNCAHNDCGLIIDVNADLSLSKDDLRSEEIKYVRLMIHMANRLNVRRLRICLGGQFINIQNLVKKYRRSIESSTLADRSASTNSSIFFCNWLFNTIVELHAKTYKFKNN